MAAAAITLPIATPAVAPEVRPLETGVDVSAVVELVVAVVREIWEEEEEEVGEAFTPVSVPRPVVTGLRRTVDVYPEYPAHPYPTEPCS
jgi:hypothetical protein